MAGGNLSGPDQLPHTPRRMGMKYFTIPPGIFGWRIVECDPAKGIAFTKIQSTKPCLANLCGILKNCVENRLKVSCRGTNNPEHISRCGLLLERFAQFVEQPRVLDCDDGLRCEGFEQFDLLVRERTNFHSAYQDRPNRYAFAQQWRCKRGPMAVAFRVLTAFREFGVFCGKVMNVNCAALDYRAPGNPTSIDRKPLGRVASCRNSTVRGYLPKHVGLQAEDHGIICVAQVSGVFTHHVQRRRQLAR